MRLICSEMQEGKPIPRKFTCDGEDISPRFQWEDAPQSTKCFVLVVHDPDAPRQGGFTHWLLYDIPANVKEICEHVPKNQEKIAGLGVQGKNDAGTIGYMGPCPPSGTHRYIAVLYAMRNDLDLKPGATARDVERATEGHILDRAETMGTYARSRARSS